MQPLTVTQPTPRSARALVAAALAAAGLLAGLTGCASDPASTTGGSGSSAGESSASGAAEGASSGSGEGSGSVEVTGDSRCADGESVEITADNAQVVLSGQCGSVTISGSGVQANIDSAESVEITGEDASLLGDTWGTARVSAANATLNVTTLDEFTTTVASTTLINQKVGTAQIEGKDAVLNGVDADKVVLKSDGATVILSGSLGALEVQGDENSVSWVDGTEAASPHTGSGNSFERRG